MPEETQAVHQVTHYDAKGTPQRVAVATGTRTMAMIATDSKEGLDAAAIEQKRKDLEEIDALRQQNARELLSVTDLEVNGKLQPRVGAFQYVLADGRKERLGETVAFADASRAAAAQPDLNQPPAEGLKTRLTMADWKELHELMVAHQGEALDTYAEEVLGKVLQFTRVKYVLSDGTEVIRSGGKPGSPQ